MSRGSAGEYQADFYGIYCKVKILKKQVYNKNISSISITTTVYVVKLNLKTKEL